ncbi:CHAT domain-containing protein [Methylomonas sp. HW2-6]|uniref:CHAT domain-containing protein n=1 Tax=Methylomonas sp. HW2-6 TaxID=3376687 RepID=UPI00404242E7
MSKLERLRYVIAQEQDLLAVPDKVREAAVNELGDDVAEILAEIRSLLAETSTARGEIVAQKTSDEAQFIHLSLVLGGDELALIPFEIAFSPQAYPGDGLPFCLQLALPIVPTRQTRRTQPVFTNWNVEQEPKILLVAAAPGGLEIPLTEHLHAIRIALEPWINWPSDTEGPITEEKRLPFVKQRIRVLVNASLEDIYSACATEQFTHIHILAHGGAYELAGERQFGVVLCDERDRSKVDVVSGKRLAKALHAESNDGSWRSNPLMVTLATCDSGNPGSILVPGGSIAHELHCEGIPWILASQFPLTKAGSVLMAEEIYPKLLRGDDPRIVLHELRRKLFLNTQRNHDWASVIAYAVIPQNFDDSVTRFFEIQSRRAIEISFARVDNLASFNSDFSSQEVEITLNRIKALLDVWRRRLRMGSGAVERARRAECFGMHGSAFKRISLLYSAQKNQEKAKVNLQIALSHYQSAMRELASGSSYHWVASQVLSLTAVLGVAKDPDMLIGVMHLARIGLQSESTSEQAWAHGTLAELEMLSIYHQELDESAIPDITERVRKHCLSIVDLMGVDSFQVESTQRQFQRYVDYWDGSWREIARGAVIALS